jgi:hypothetical protein
MAADGLEPLQLRHSLYASGYYLYSKAPPQLSDGIDDLPVIGGIWQAVSEAAVYLEYINAESF